MKDWLSIGEFSKLTGFSNKALRIYEERGLLVAHTKGENQYRYYHIQQKQSAQKIHHFKNLGFSLDQIKILLSASTQDDLKSLLELRLQESFSEAKLLSEQIIQLQSILTSLNLGDELTEQQREQVMESLMQTSLGNLKRRGLLPSDETKARLSSEISALSPELKSALPAIQDIVSYANENNIFLGSGRGSSPASLILFSQGYAPFDPMKFGLVPEIFAHTKNIWLEVEYSRHQEIGKLCDLASGKSNFEVIAFRSPFLDILREMQQQIGTIHFDQFSDEDPMILQAPQRLGARGLWDIEWNPNFDAFQSMSSEDQKKFMVDQDFLMGWLERNEIRDAEDFMNISMLAYFAGPEVLNQYRGGTCPDYLPELKLTNGLLIYREDWLRIFMNHTGFTASKANAVFNALKKKEVDSPLYNSLDLVSHPEVKKILFERAPYMFLKSHMVSSWWHYKRTAILKSLWAEQYLAALDNWEQQNSYTWQEFGYKRPDGTLFLKA